jgi:hypothetical protein
LKNLASASGVYKKITVTFTFSSHHVFLAWLAVSMRPTREFGSYRGTHLLTVRICPMTDSTHSPNSEQDGSKLEFVKLAWQSENGMPRHRIGNTNISKRSFVDVTVLAYRLVAMEITVAQF